MLNGRMEPLGAVEVIIIRKKKSSVIDVYHRTT